MQFERRAQRKKNVRLTGARREKANLYPHRLQFYRLPPIDNITLTDFEDYAINRLKGNILFNIKIHFATILD